MPRPPVQVTIRPLSAGAREAMGRRVASFRRNALVGVVVGAVLVAIGLVLNAELRIPVLALSLTPLQNDELTGIFGLIVSGVLALVIGAASSLYLRRTRAEFGRFLERGTATHIEGESEKALLPGRGWIGREIGEVHFRFAGPANVGDPTVPPDTYGDPIPVSFDYVSSSDFAAEQGEGWLLAVGERTVSSPVQMQWQRDVSKWHQTPDPPARGRSSSSGGIERPSRRRDGAVAPGDTLPR